MAKKKARKRQEIPADESKAERFVRVVTPRVSKAVKAIRQIGFCAAANYEYTFTQIEQIHNALTESVNALASKFEKQPDAQDKFNFID